MATYDLTLTTPSNIVTGDILNCPYSGTYKSITLSKGTYKLECWGAQGGNGSYSGSTGGKGGYSIGTITLQEPKQIYLYVGGSGKSGAGSSSLSGGFNGGGNAGGSQTTTSSSAGTGGGASDIRINSTSLYARVIVAGGGGGACGDYDYAGTGGYGGGTSGGIGIGQSDPSGTNGYHGNYGSQISGGGISTSWNDNQTAGSFGTGGRGAYLSNKTPGGGGGAGWYGGGGGVHGSPSDASGGGGGSGYVYTSSTASNYPSGCLLNSSMYLTNAQTIAGNTLFPSTSGSTETGHSGNGYIRISVIHVDRLPLKIKQNGEWKDISKGYTRVSGLWKEIDKVFRKVSGEWIEN